MKPWLLILLYFLLPSPICLFAQSGNSSLKLSTTHSKDSVQMNGMEKSPQFKGNLYEYIYQNLNLPYLITPEKSGMVAIDFTVNKKGKILNPKIVRSLTPEIDSACLNVFNAMPPW
jgi:hypothetical protein